MPPGSAASGSQATWTMMVYAVADTQNIGPVMEQDLADLAALPDDPCIGPKPGGVFPETWRSSA